MIRLRIEDLEPTESILFPEELGEAIVVSGGVYVFKPGETAHPEAVHVHDVDEVFIVVQGSGVLPIDGVDHPIVTGDIIIVEKGEDHHTRSSVDDPLVTAWYVMDR